MRENIFQKYKEYLLDNPKGYWFKRKVYGWGWIPAKIEGWIVTLVSIIYMVYIAIEVNTTENLRLFYIKLIVTIILLIVICYKTGEPPKWSWGFSKKSNSRRN